MVSTLSDNLRIAYAKFRRVNYKLPIVKRKFLALLGATEFAIYEKKLGRWILLYFWVLIFEKWKENTPFEYYIKHNTQKYHDLFCTTEYHIMSTIIFFKTIETLLN